MKHINDLTEEGKKSVSKFVSFHQSPRKSNIMKMRLIKFFLGVLFLCIIFSSCNYLDYNESSQYEKDNVFSVFDRNQAFLTNIYSYLPSDFSSVDGAMRSSATDDAKHVWDLSAIQKFNDGSWNSVVTLDNQWNSMYSGIRAVNTYLKESAGQTFSGTKYNSDYAAQMQQFALYPYEARFLRAFFYFELIKRYGDVPLVTTVLTPDQANKVVPAKFDSIIKFIVSECDSAARKLPKTFSNFSTTKETGRATKGAAWALKSRVLLYAASPLHNPNALPLGDPKWIAAAKAAKMVIDSLKSQYTPLPSYTTTFNNLTSKELIFERREALSNYFEYANTAVGFAGGNTGTCPTQNLVDAYEMKSTGKGINETGSGYNASTPYVGRDPRFVATILYDGAVWKTPQVLQIWNGGLNAPPKSNATKTGYYLKKYLLESISLDPALPTTGLHCWTIFRYAEILLNYSEAMNEAYGPDVPGGDPVLNLTARSQVNVVRNRTGVAMPVFPAGMTQAAFRDKLRNERRIELAFEDHRFWDIRRWKIGNTVKDIYGIDITKDGSGGLTYTRKLVENRIWDEKMNLYPIPQTELNINSNLKQNQGW
ncbi:MAG: RagB/SusD family nutrient uptake outer membrane protein [Paludibacter sp.]|nr:RagB/SusD family nutrient uptake outer membrane protein [Paludibacter sp.]